jgi:hydrogenase nickel incorporation protein HypA/HybF
MHELSIAEAVVGIVSRHAHGRRVHRVNMRVGHLRQVVPSALEFAFEIAAAGGPVEGAVLAIEDVPVTGDCRVCGRRSAMGEFPLRCPDCGGIDVEIVTGEELQVESLELEEKTEIREMEQI